MIAERLASCLDQAMQSIPDGRRIERQLHREALDAWHQHQADLDTLAQAQQEGA